MSLERLDGTIVCHRCIVAETPLARMRGLLGRRRLALGEGVLLRPAKAVHTWFMRFGIDAVFLDRDLEVLRIAPLPPWRTALCRRADAVLELPSGTARGLALREGERLRRGAAPAHLR